ncbi:hypothetical protein [Fodinicola acaciae]|uniref:hypothetical protein n=1 Tax=Fodinicola acaciae TaxID=2681555 RepID=UPI0013D2AE4A|nr:hypothetical protein [Fodinicola acaciae]
MTTSLPDSVLDAIACEPVRTRPARLFCAVTGPPAATVVTDFLSLQHWSKLRYFLEGVRRQAGADFDDAGFAYDTDERDPDEVPFTGVELYMPWDGVLVSRSAFDRLMARFFAAVTRGAIAQDDAATREPWWPDFVAAVDDIQRRCDNQK